MATERDLIQRMAKALDLYRQLLRDDCTLAHALADEARTALSQPEPLTQASIALQMLDTIEHDSFYPPEVTAPIRCALEALHHDH